MHIPEAALSWLLEEDNPSVRYLTLVNILDRLENDKEVVKARARLMEEGFVAKVLTHQNLDGSFVSKWMVEKYSKERARTGYQPKYKATTWQALFLAQMGANAEDERIKQLGGFILKANYNPEYKVFGIIAPTGVFAALPCFVSNMVWALSKLGFYEDGRVQDSIKWLLKFQRFDDGDFEVPKEWPYSGPKDRCWGRHSCYSGCTKALRAITVIPKADRSKEINDFIKRAIDFILLHKIYKRSHSTDEPIRKEYELFTFPLTNYDDMLGVLESLLFFKAKDKAIDDAINLILKKKNKNGRWILEKTLSSSSMYSKIEEQGKESKWITYRILHILKNYFYQGHFS